MKYKSLNNTYLIVNMWGYLLVLFLFTGINSSCKKYLDKNPTNGIKQMSSLSDVQALLDNSWHINEYFDEISDRIADDYYYAPGTWGSAPINNRLNYVWDANANADWNQAYRPVYYANVALQSLERIGFNNDNVGEYNIIRGHALFVRSLSFFYLAQLYCKPYDAATANEDLGIPLRTVPDIEEPSIRSSVEETYFRIISDLKEAVNVLPKNATTISRPNKAAAYGVLAKTYLSMRDYANAAKYSDSSLKNYNALLDYNSVDTVSNNPFSINNPEIIYYGAASSLGNTQILIDTILISQYDINDLRKPAYFRPITGGKYIYKGSYVNVNYNINSGSNSNRALFYGIATDDIYLILAECVARDGLKDSAMNVLNKLLEKRWKTGTFIPYTATTSEIALSKVLTERRKELFFRGTRWSDLRRFNKEGANITLKRIVDGNTYLLPPNDLRWVLLIPSGVILTTGMPQNPR